MVSHPLFRQLASSPPPSHLLRYQLSSLSRVCCNHARPPHLISRSLSSYPSSRSSPSSPIGRDFEANCRNFLESLHASGNFTSHSHDGGIDLRGVWGMKSEEVSFVAQCKATAGPVGVEDVREFLAVLKDRKDVGFFFSKNGFTSYALQLSKGNTSPLLLCHLSISPSSQPPWLLQSCLPNIAFQTRFPSVRIVRQYSIPNHTNLLKIIEVEHKP
eukprot:TRINITY_DN742_c0_g1_i4.p1 TRINITY_DN742_c0_g1~~TRINITY_DN742_c0_g1_i4.p1  ORF type:complete len:215 (-),score=24.08 TRINITY_DN742_c0_g1_i4:29-673(-)